MTIKSFFLLTIFFIGTKLNAQDFISDSLTKEITYAKSDSAKASLLIDLAKNKWDQLRGDTAIIILNSALDFSKQKRFNRQEVESIRLLADYYNNSNTTKKDIYKGYLLTLQAIHLSRQYQYKGLEADLLLYLSSHLNNKTDSVELLIQQAYYLSLQYHLIEQQISSLTRKAEFIAANNQDSAKMYFYQGLALSRNARLPKSEVTLLGRMAITYSTNHWGDSSNYFIQKAIEVSRSNLLASQELNLLRACLGTRGAFFLKDSMIPYFERSMLLCRQIHRDSLRLMNGFAQSCMDIINYPKALQTFLTVLHICESKKDSSGIEATLDQIGNLFQTVKDYKKSVDYYNEAIKYGTKNMFYYLFAHVDISLSYIKLKQNDSARKYADKAYQIAIEFYNGPNKIYGGVLNSLGEVYDGLGDDSLAYKYLQRSYSYFTQVAVDVSNYGESTIGLANYFKRIGKMDSSIFYAKKCLLACKPKGYLLNVYESSSIISEYFQKLHQIDSAYYYQQISFEAYKTLYSDDASNQFRDLFYAEQQREKDQTQAKIVAAEKYASNLRLYALIAVIIIGIIIGMIIYRNNRQKERAFELLKKQKQEIDTQKLKLEESFNHLQNTQAQLVQSEKMASLGELTAGIAHEIQNPLNFINNFSEINQELLTELGEEIDKGNYEEVKKIAKDVIDNEAKINHHGKRADGIVKGMLQHSRSSSGVKELTDINALADEYLRLSYHGLRAKDKSFNAKMETNLDPSIGNVHVVPQDIGRVILNLFTNAFYVVDEKKKKGALNYDPTVSLTTKKTANHISISVKDNGNGIAQKNLEKIFQPFFTTKPTGQGTGLGLSLSYDIVKAHGGELKVTTKEGEGTEFIIILPK